MLRRFAWTTGLLLLAAGACAHARAPNTTVKLWPGVAPGSEQWTWKEQDFQHVVVGGKDLGTIIEDVVTPNLTVYLPEHPQARHAGIIIAPGGACVALSMEASGQLASWLQQRGIAAFVLKYRIPRKTFEGPPPADLNEDLACKWGIADAVQALRVVRQHAAQWKLDPHRIGFVGFSAGAMLASEALAQPDPSLRPDFAGLIYGAPLASMPAIPVKLPANFKLAGPPLPPVFMAWAQDDTTAGYAMRRFYRLLIDQGYAPEAHIYHAGGHGFASKTQGTTSDHWMQELYWWLAAEGFAESSP
ncbi:MAG TPA: alpha/beta hydrolase [Rhodanobacteraceae bacterium]|nr:alpha/beta hydrolase [Rhodanobacteraceae bacterium]